MFKHFQNRNQNKYFISFTARPSIIIILLVDLAIQTFLDDFWESLEYFLLFLNKKKHLFSNKKYHKNRNCRLYIIRWCSLTFGTAFNRRRTWSIALFFKVLRHFLESNERKTGNNWVCYNTNCLNQWNLSGHVKLTVYLRLWCKFLLVLRNLKLLFRYLWTIQPNLHCLKWVFLLQSYDDNKSCEREKNDFVSIN